MAFHANTSTIDVAIIGAGISGINAAYNMQAHGKNYAVFENRSDIGGTWRLFQYPGVRSDSDLYTYGFSWNPWQSDRPIADGASIAEYIAESAAAHGIDKHIHYCHRLVKAEWSTEACRWTLTFQCEGDSMTVVAPFVIFATGYFDHIKPLTTKIQGLNQFKGTVVHPQFWPESLDCKGKKVIIIGSGATAISMLPALSQTAARTTMLQRSPAYIISMRNSDGVHLGPFLPRLVLDGLRRLYWIAYARLSFLFCRCFPDLARQILRQRIEAELPQGVSYSAHFSPRYKLWDQRVLVAPDGDFYTALGGDTVDIKTGHIRSVVAGGIQLESGEFLDADVIVTATGLRLQFGGRCAISVDGSPIEMTEKFLWRRLMMQDVPNAFFMLGYTTSSWTLAADVGCVVIDRLMNTMERRGAMAVIPRLNGDDGVRPVRLVSYDSTYVSQADGRMPLGGDRGPWRSPQGYFGHLMEARYGSIMGNLDFVEAPVKGRGNHSSKPSLELVLAGWVGKLTTILLLFLSFLSGTELERH